MALPEFSYYYFACALRIITMWLDYTFIHPTWIKMEREDCDPYDIGALILSPIKINKSCYNNYILIHSLIRIWKQINSHFKTESISTLLPNAGNPSFVPSTLDSAFTKWKDLGIRMIGDLFVKGSFASFNHLQVQYGLHRHNFFRYLQIRDYVKKYIPNLEKIEPNILDGFFRLGGRERRLLSLFYNSLLLRTSPSVQGVKTCWEQELDIKIDADLWNNQTSTDFITLKQNYTKSFQIYPHYVTNAILKKLLFPTVCSKLTQFRTNIFQILSDMFCILMKPDPLLVVLGVSDQFSSLNKCQ